MASGFSKERPLKDLITSRNSSCGKVMFSQASISHSVHRGIGYHWSYVPSGVWWQGMGGRVWGVGYPGV